MLQLVIPLHQQLRTQLRANLKCFVIIPDGQIAFGKLAQAIAYGAKIIQINGNFDDGMSIIKNIADEQSNVCVVNSLNPLEFKDKKLSLMKYLINLARYPISLFASRKRR